MKILNSQSFADALTRCYENPKYKVCIAFTNFYSIRRFMNELRKNGVDKLPYADKFVFRTDHARIEYQNGSCVDIFIASDYARGKRCNDLLYEEGMPQDIIDNILRRIIIPDPWAISVLGKIISYEEIKSILMENDEGTYSESDVEQCSDSEDEDGESDTNKLDEFLNSFKIVS